METWLEKRCKEEKERLYFSELFRKLGKTY